MKTTQRSTAKRSFGLLISSTILSGIALSSAAHAAPDVAPAPAADQVAAEGQETVGAGNFGDIVVTATRNKESIQRVPISMQALGADTLAERQVKGLTDFVALLPSVSFAGIGPGRNTPYFRGIVPAGGTYASVGYYLDDIPITGTGVPDIHAYDMERVEALAGPQGTLYGAGSLAGTIRLITKKPKIGVFEAGYDIQGNKYGKGGYGGMLESYMNIPVSDTLAFRIMGYYRKEGGYIDNTPNNGKLNNGAPAVYQLGDENPATSYALSNASIAKKDYNPIYEYGGRVSALWEPVDGWEITPMISGQRQISYGYFGFDPRVGDLQVHDYDLTRQDDKWYQAQLSVHGHIGDWDVVSATGYFNRKTNLRNDYTYYTVTYDGFGPGYESYLQFFDKSGCTGSGATQKCSTLINPTQYYHAVQYRQKFTQELRLSTPKSWPFDVTVGGFFHWQKQENNTYYAIHGLDNIAGYTEAGGGDSNPAGFGIPVAQGGTMVTPTDADWLNPAVKEDGYYINEQNLIYHDEAIFAEAHYNITPKLKITGGIRYFWTDYSIKGFAGVSASAVGVGCPVPLPAGRLSCLNTNPAAADGTGKYKEDGETHKVAVNWQVTPSKMVYANYSTGFRPGGFNRPLRIRTNGLGLTTVDPFKSETLTNYEVGFKTTWNNVFRLNVSAYYEKWDNIQYSVVVAGAQGAGITGNAGKAVVKGLEYDAELKLGKITLATNGAYNDAKLDGNFCNFAVNFATRSIGQLASCVQGQSVAGTSPPTPQVAAADGTRLPRQPKFKGTSSARYDTDLGEYRGYIQGAALYQTGATQDLNVSNARLLGDTKGFISFDFSAGIKKDGWHADIFIQNAFDRRGELTKNTFCSIDFCSGSSRTFAIRPQFFGIKFGQSF
jgi:outer membrane receptor protein involved in Fe transport